MLEETGTLTHLKIIVQFYSSLQCFHKLLGFYKTCLSAWVSIASHFQNNTTRYPGALDPTHSHQLLKEVLTSSPSSLRFIPPPCTSMASYCWKVPEHNMQRSMISSSRKSCGGSCWVVRKACSCTPLPGSNSFQRARRRCLRFYFESEANSWFVRWKCWTRCHQGGESEWSSHEWILSDNLMQLGFYK